MKSNQIGERMRTGETPGTALGRARPSTAVRAVGFSSDSLIDPFNQAARKTVVLESKKEDT